LYGLGRFWGDRFYFNDRGGRGPPA
jgi:hypothetical protein